MLNKLIEVIERLGGRTTCARCPSAEHVLVQLDATVVEFVVMVRERAPYPAEVSTLDPSLANLAAHTTQWRLRPRPSPLLVTRYISQPLGDRLSARGWSWIDAAGNCDLRGPGLRIHVRSPERPQPRPGKLPLGPANLLIIRCVLGSSARTSWTTGELSTSTGSSTVVVTQTMRRLESLSLCSHAARGSWTVNPAALLDRFMSDYQGSQGSERYFYGAVDLRALAAHVSSQYRIQVAVSADVGPDLLAPWRVPTTLILYSRPTVRLPTQPHLVPVTTIGAANVVQVFPKDETVFPRVSLLAATPSDGDVQLADPVQMIWDLGRLGGEDREHAAHEMRQWLNR